MSRKGFTIIELMTSTAIVGIISMMAINQYGVIRQKAYRATAAAHLKNAYTAIQSKAADNLSDPGKQAGSTYYSNTFFYPDGETYGYQYNQQSIEPTTSNVSHNTDIILPGYRKQSHVFLRSYVLRTRQNNGTVNDYTEIISAHCGIRPTEDTLTFYAYVITNGAVSEYEYYDFDNDAICTPED